jgi:hypothetical protein
MPLRRYSPGGFRDFLGIAQNAISDPHDRTSHGGCRLILLPPEPATDPSHNIDRLGQLLLPDLLDFLMLLFPHEFPLGLMSDLPHHPHHGTLHVPLLEEIMQEATAPGPYQQEGEDEGHRLSIHQRSSMKPLFV